MVRRFLAVAAVMSAVALAGCAPNGRDTPSPEPVVTTPTVSPSPQWTEEEQGAIDAVQKYLEVWTSISQDLVDSDWNAIRDVASDPAANDATTLWFQWVDNGWHLVGAPSFEVDLVTQGGTDYQGTRYHVHGCYITTGSHLSDSDGNPLTKQGADRSTANYLVLRIVSPEDKYYVLEDVTEGNPC